MLGLDALNLPAAAFGVVDSRLGGGEEFRVDWLVLVDRLGQVAEGIEVGFRAEHAKDLDLAHYATLAIRDANIVGKRTEFCTEIGSAAAQTPRE